MNKIFLTSIKESYTEQEIQKFAAMLPDSRIEKLSCFRLRDDYMRSLLGEAMVRIQAALEFGERPESLKIDRDSYGKPFFVDYPEYHFSISHSGDWVACMRSNQKCGIDIEKMDDLKMGIAERFFTAQEYEMICTADPDWQKDVFYDLWTLKECYMKYDGRGLKMGLQNAAFGKREGEYYLISEPADKLYFRQVDVIEGYKISVCMEIPEYLVQVVSLKVNFSGT